jgi:putative membrane protein
VSLLLVFRTNTAYDRYWEARKLWAVLFTHTRSLARKFLVDIKDFVENEAGVTKKGAINILLAYAVACKHHLRREYGINYEDLYHLLSHIPRFHRTGSNIHIKNLP